VAPAGASDADVARTKSSMRAQAAEQLAKLASINRQIEQKRAESDSVTATIAKIDATMLQTAGSPMIQSLDAAEN